jgi:hypothetical protein
VKEHKKQKNQKKTKTKNKLSVITNIDNKAQKMQRKTKKSGTKRKEKGRTDDRPHSTKCRPNVNQQDDTDNVPCLYCGELYSESVDGWVWCATSGPMTYVPERTMTLLLSYVKCVWSSLCHLRQCHFSTFLCAVAAQVTYYLNSFG